MSLDARQGSFEHQLKSYVPLGAHLSPCYGTSNIARMVPGGIVFAVTNLANYSTNSGPLCLVSRICPLPNAEVYFCAVIETDKQIVLNRLQAMLDANIKGDTNYSRENNNTSVCIASDQLLYFYNKKISEIEVPVQSYLGPPVTLDKFYYAIYSPNAKSNERLILKSLITEIGVFVGSGKVTELDVWGRFNLLSAGSAANAISVGGMVQDFTNCAMSAGLQLPPGLVGRLIASLLAKRFVIFTGLSGSGKTKIAHAFSAWICAQPTHQMKLVAVGADWTSNENLLGYPDALQAGRYCKPNSGVLDLILSASSDTKSPYFLILDEMNLSHVERYFSDILSVIESGEQIGLHSNSDELNGIPASVSWPNNLFIIGTVNVDETTYMFSPKVLDRANVIEFRATADQIKTFLEKPVSVQIDDIESVGVDYALAFVESAKLTNCSLSQIPPEISGDVNLDLELKDALGEVFEALSAIGAEFGYRAAYEISRFVYFHALLSGPGWKLEESIDYQVLQKLLPKLHGSERRLGPILKRLEAYCDKRGLTNSREKINRMSDRLRDGFTSFAEA
jgi:hypothetical protein